MNLKSFPVLVFSLFLIGCTSHTIPTNSSIPKAPIVVENILPSIDVASKTNKKLETKINDQTKVIIEQKANIENAMKQAENIRKQLSEKIEVKEQDAVDLINNLKTVHTRNLFLETNNGELVKINTDLQNQLEDAKTIAAKKDDEVSNLRQIDSQKNKIIDDQNLELIKIAKERDSAVVKASKSTVYRNWVWGLIGGFLLWTILKNILMIYMPTTKFRI